MKKILSRRPSPAVIIAIVALIVALTGTAVAGGGFLTTKKFKKQAVRGPVQYVTNNDGVPNVTNSYQLVSATCPAGTKPVGGGIKIPDPNQSGAAYVADAYITTTGYAGHVTNNSPAATTATVTANCVTVKSTSGTPPAS